MSADKHHRTRAQVVPVHPEYNDELSPAQIETIRKLADPDGKRAAKRVLLYPSVA